MSVIEDIYNKAMPYYRKSEVLYVNVATHMKVVYNMMRAICLGEGYQRTTTEVLLISAILHDIGLYKSHMPKIVESEIEQEQDAKKRAYMISKALQARMEHCIKGVEIACMILPIYDLNGAVIIDILELIYHHDDTKIYNIDKNYINQMKINLSNMLWIVLNEADSLWMLTEDGLEADRKRAIKHGKIPMTRNEQLRYNVQLHKKRYNLYCEINPNTARDFQHGTMYLTKTGYEIYKRLTKDI